MKQFNVTGMSCAACSARVEKAVNGVDGVTSCAVNLLTNSMGVEGTASDKEIIKAVENAGYGASLKSEEVSDPLRDTETPKIKKRLILSLVFLLPLMYVSMGHMMLKLPLPNALENHIINGALQLVLSLIVVLINRKFFISGFKGVIHRSPNMDTLVSLGAGASFIYSTVILIIMSRGVDVTNIIHASDALYFDSAAMILTLITVGKLLEAYSKGRTTDALKGLMSLVPKTANVIRDCKEQTIPEKDVIIGDVFVVRSGESIPVDGIIIEGNAAVDEAALTGESIPVDKAAGDSVSAATINSSGYIECKATRVGKDTTLSQIIKLVSDTAATKAPIAKTADKVSGIFVPVVIIIAFLTFIITLFFGHEFGYALSRGITVLVISCPCALGLATPVAIMVGSGKGAKSGILFKSAAALEEAGRTQIVVLDKTGTVTKGEMQLTDIIPNGISSQDLLLFAYSLEIKSEHPLAKAVCKYAFENGVKPLNTQDFKTLSGNGVTAVIREKECFGGSIKFISEKAEITPEFLEKAESLASEGKTPLAFVSDGKLLGIIALADVIKDDSPEAVKQLQNMGIRVLMLTGDNKRTAEAVGKQTGVDAVISDVLPDGKESVIRQLQKFGKVAMVGDGINDAPALTRADIGFAVRTGSDIASDAADVVLLNSKLTDVPAAIRLSRATLRNIHENLFWAFIYNIICIPLATGFLVTLTGWTLSPVIGAAAMSLSSFCVVTNALRLNLVKVNSAEKDKKTEVVEIDIEEIKENRKMTKTIKIEGMMCPHCEAAVKSALEALDGVENATASHEEDKAVVILSEDVDDELLKKAVEGKDYVVTGIE